MTIGSLSEDQFSLILEGNLRPSRPVDTTELLFGREVALERMREAYGSTGRQVFIYGDRGVGKTSVAKTAAYALSPATSSPVYVAAGQGTTFQTLIRDIFARMVSPSELAIAKKTSKLGANLSAVVAEATTETQTGGIPVVSDVNSAILALQNACRADIHRRRVVVIDEFDQLQDPKDQELFAQFIKQLGDQEVPLCFVFVGIGRSLDGLLKGHESCYRYIESVPLERLNFTGRWEIIDKCATELEVKVNEDSRLRIAQISDGFPHFVHLVCHKLFWVAFREDYPITVIQPEHYQEAVRQSVLAIEAHLKQAYETATRKYKDEYQEILWAVADHFELLRNTEGIYGSYRRIMQVREKEPMDRRTLSSRLNSLKSDMCGRILVSQRRSWFEFSESMVRGYVRLRAEMQNVRLALEHEPVKDPPQSLKLKLSARVPGGR
jgi:uncharacterized protein